MSTSDSTRDPLGLGERRDPRDRPPTRYDEEGKSLPERGSGYLPATAVEVPHEPEKLVIPAEAVAYLLNLVVQGQPGNAWWNGFVTAHGIPSWVADGEWRFAAQAVEVVKAPRQSVVGTNGSVSPTR